MGYAYADRRLKDDACWGGRKRGAKERARSLPKHFDWEWRIPNHGNWAGCGYGEMPYVGACLSIDVCKDIGKVIRQMLGKGVIVCCLCSGLLGSTESIKKESRFNLKYTVFIWVQHPSLLKKIK